MANTEHMSVVTWSAEMSGRREIPTVVTDARGKAGFVFDFPNRRATVTITTRNIKDVEKIELRIRRSAHDASGPAAIVIYDAKDGPYSGRLTRVLPASRFKELATLVLNGRATVTVCTKSHPDGEITGRVQMHKSYE
ncbi:MAG: CHRD domain-containing protein [Terriglobales bacterium]